jgi:hypothetical protein
MLDGGESVEAAVLAAWHVADEAGVFRVSILKKFDFGVIARPKMGRISIQAIAHGRKAGHFIFIERFIGNFEGVARLRDVDRDTNCNGNEGDLPIDVGHASRDTPAEIHRRLGTGIEQRGEE